MSPRLMHSCVWLVVAFGALCLTLLPSGTAQEPESARIARQKLKEWENDRYLRKFLASPAETPTKPEIGTSPGTEQALALHVAVNKLGNFYGEDRPTLTSCENDLKLMKRLASQAQFTHLEPLVDEAATKKNVLKQIERASNQLQSGGIFLFTFSGHGMQFPEAAEGEEADHMDEALCLHDQFILDNELAAWWKEFNPGVRIVLVLDCCHSETSAADRLLKHSKENKKSKKPPKPLPSEDSKKLDEALTVTKDGKKYQARKLFEQSRQHVLREHPPKKKAQSHKADYQQETKATVITLAAATDFQLAWGDKDNGFFTKALVEVWDDTDFEGSYRQFLNEIALKLLERTAKEKVERQSPRMDSYPAPDLRFSRQRPFTTKAP